MLSTGDKLIISLNSEIQIINLEQFELQDRQKRLTYAMKINQELVKHLQIMQMKESAINKERYAVFSHKFRGLEYQIRRFVETYLRDAVSSLCYVPLEVIFLFKTLNKSPKW